MNYSQFSELCKTKNIRINDVCEHIGMTRPGLTKALDNETIEIRKLKLLCEYVRISPALFFDVGTFGSIQKSDASNSENINALKLEIEYLKKSLRDKEEIIQLLREKGTGYGLVAEPGGYETKLK